jgi:AbiV family abortive infection protein
MKNDHPKYFPTMLRLEHNLLHNAGNLLTDACILYKAKSYPTAFALAVLAFEELGKLHMIDHVGFETGYFYWDQESKKLRLRDLFSSKNAYNHVAKQRWALLETGKYSDQYRNGRLDHLKQAAFYVGFRKGRIKAPDRLSATTAYNQIKRVVKLIKQTNDMAFIQPFEQSSAATRRKALRYVKAAEECLAEIKAPRRKGRITKKKPEIPTGASACV